MPIPFSDLVERLRIAAGAQTQRDLARLLGYPEGDAERKVQKWFHAKRGSYEATIEVLDAFGFITDTGRDYLGLADQPRVEAALDLSRGAGERLRRQAQRGPREEAS